MVHDIYTKDFYYQHFIEYDDINKINEFYDVNLEQIDKDNFDIDNIKKELCSYLLTEINEITLTIRIFEDLLANTSKIRNFTTQIDNIHLSKNIFEVLESVIDENTDIVKLLDIVNICFNITIEQLGETYSKDINFIKGLIVFLSVKYSQNI